MKVKLMKRSRIGDYMMYTNQDILTDIATIRRRNMFDKIINHTKKTLSALTIFVAFCILLYVSYYKECLF